MFLEWSLNWTSLQLCDFRLWWLMMQPSVDLVVFVHFITYLFVLQGSLHRGPVLHLLSESAVACAGHVLLLHGRPDATHCRLLILQHVCEAFGIQQKKEGRERERKRGERGIRGKEGSKSNHFTQHGRSYSGSCSNLVNALFRPHALLFTLSLRYIWRHPNKSVVWFKMNAYNMVSRTQGWQKRRQRLHLH